MTKHGGVELKYFRKGGIFKQGRDIFGRSPSISFLISTIASACRANILLGLRHRSCLMVLTSNCLLKKSEDMSDIRGTPFGFREFCPLCPFNGVIGCKVQVCGIAILFNIIWDICEILSSEEAITLVS
jgi:hypothetical protein